MTITQPTIRKLKLVDLEKAVYNPRLIDNDAMRGLRESLTTFGMLEMPVVNLHGGKRVLVSGHQRVSAMVEEGFQFADCVVVDYDPLKEKMANLAMNNPAIQGAFDPVKAMPSLDAIALQLPKPDFAGFEKLSNELRAEAEKIGKAAKQSEANDDGDTAKIEKPVSKLGTVYKLGKHRLYCGPMEIGLPKLLGKKKAHACITDPPYAVAYESAAGESIENDNLTGAEWQAFVDMFCKEILLRTDGACYVFMASKEIPALQEGWEKAGGVVHRWLVWAKDRFTLSRGDYHHQYEPALFGYRVGVTPPAPSKARTNVLECPKPQTNDLHPTQKPTELIRDIVTDATQPGQLVIDPFSGSGTTLAVCEETGRICYGCELSEVFCDRIRRRWAEQTAGLDCDWLSLTPAVS